MATTTPPALIAGDFHVLHPHGEACFAYLRHIADTEQTCLVIFTFSSQAQTLSLDFGHSQPSLLFSRQVR